MLKYLRITSQANNYKGKYALCHLEKCIVNVTANQMCKILFFTDLKVGKTLMRTKFICYCVCLDVVLGNQLCLDT